MRIALITDVHSNILALEAVLCAIRKHRPDCILSLGDQVNLGPCPRETLAMLREEGVICLHGNHERYILAAMDNAPAYAGANFESLRFNASLLTRSDITLPKTWSLEGVTFTHAMPDDDRFPVFDEEKALPLLRAMHFPSPTHIICGHGHNPTHIRCGNLTLDSIGSVGCMDDGIPGTAPYALLTLDHGDALLRPYFAAYDTRTMKSLFQRGGMAAWCPVMARIACMQMTLNTDILVSFVQQAHARSRERGESSISMQTWMETDAAYAWPDGQTTADFWRG
ncbi:MAG: metallophosphoesterase family protein [Christensenellales bacterium]|nr:metallophosphoesterase family protein [Christensenellales bacterium]